jgi:predicted transcriptional regulator
MKLGEYLDNQRRLLTLLQQLESDLRDNSDRLAAALRQKRDELGLTNAQIAEKAKVPYASLVNWMYGNNMLPEKEALRIFAALGTEKSAQTRGGRPVPKGRIRKRKLLTR